MQGLAYSAVVAVLLWQNELRARTYKCFIYQNKKAVFSFCSSFYYLFFSFADVQRVLFYLIKDNAQKVGHHVCECVLECMHEWVSSESVSDFACYFYPFINYDHDGTHKQLFKILQVNLMREQPWTSTVWVGKSRRSVNDFLTILQLHLQAEGVSRYKLAQDQAFPTELWMCNDGHFCPSPPA